MKPDDDARRHPHPNRLCPETMPPVQRGAMIARPWAGLLVGLAMALLTALGARGACHADAAIDASWARAAARRRRKLLVLVLGSAALATAVLQAAAPPGSAAADWQTLLFGLLFAWVAAGCVTAVMGYFSLARGDRHAIDAAGLRGRPIEAGARTAIVMPICNEDIATVSAGLLATCRSLAEAMRSEGVAAGSFDVYMLSDTGDAALRDAELAAWRTLRDAVEAEGDAGIRIYYRWRQRRSMRKAGNVADFCRRWGAAYRYMLVLDADSVMSGEAVLTLVRAMEAHPRAGIVQSAPRPCGHDSLHARLQQFAARVTGPLFTAGLRYWQLGESHYWGHNAILRVAPFMQHCALARLAGKGGLAGDILSHDFVEAALMRRAGWEVWLLPEVEGSYEQPPPHLVDELQRDRRWCQGNLQNARLVAEPGLAGVHRAMFVTGAMSYLASPLWLAFVLLGVLPWVVGGAPDGGTSPAAPGLPDGALLLWPVTLAMLFLPRVLAVRLVLLRGEQAAYGGSWRLVHSALLEALMSALQAPVRMVAHSVFVVGALTGLKLNWKSPSREASDLGWREAFARFGVSGALVAAGSAWWLAGRPDEAWRVLPLALPLVFAVPLAVWSSRSSIGQRWRERGWLLVPEETRLPAVLRAARAELPRPALPAATAARPAAGPTALGAAGASMALHAPRRALAMAIFALVAGAVGIAPRSLGNSGLTSSDLAAMRIVMQASSPDAAPLVLESSPPVRAMKRVSAAAVNGARAPLRRAALPI